MARRTAASFVFSEYGQTQLSPPWRNFLLLFASNAHYHDGYTGQFKPAVPILSIEEQTTFATEMLNHDQTVQQIKQLSAELSGVFSMLEAPFEAVRMASNVALKALNMSKEMGSALISSLASFDVAKFVDDAELAMTDKEARQRLADTIKDAVLEFLLEYLPSMPIPMIEGEGDGLLYTISHLSFSQLKIRKEDVKVLIDHDDNAQSSKLTVTATNMSSLFRGLMWSYKQTYFPYMEAGGACDADVTGVDVSMSFDYHHQRTTSSGTIGPWVTLEKCDAKIQDIKMEMSETNASASGDWSGVASGWFHSNMAAFSKDNIKTGVTRSLISTLQEISQESVLPPLNNMLAATTVAQKGAKAASKIIKRQSSKLRPKNSKKQLRILMVGLNKSGKLEILQRLNLDKSKVVHQVVTPGFDVGSINYSLALLGYTDLRMSEKLEVWDVGGHYYAKTRGLVFVVDACDKTQVVLAKVELARMLFEDGMRESQLLVWANHTGDASDAMSVDELSQALGLDQLTERQWHVQLCSSETGEGLKEGLDWLGMNVADLQSKEESRDAAPGRGSVKPANLQIEGQKSPKPKASQRKTRPAPASGAEDASAEDPQAAAPEAVAGEEDSEPAKDEPTKDSAALEKEKAEAEAESKAWATSRRAAVEEAVKRRESQSESDKSPSGSSPSPAEGNVAPAAPTSPDEAPHEKTPPIESPPEQTPADGSTSSEMASSEAAPGAHVEGGSPEKEATPAAEPSSGEVKPNEGTPDAHVANDSPSEEMAVDEAPSGRDAPNDEASEAQAANENPPEELPVDDAPSSGQVPKEEASETLADEK